LLRNNSDKSPLRPGLRSVSEIPVDMLHTAAVISEQGLERAEHRVSREQREALVRARRLKAFRRFRTLERSDTAGVLCCLCVRARAAVQKNRTGDND